MTETEHFWRIANEQRAALRAGRTRKARWLTDDLEAIALHAESAAIRARAEEAAANARAAIAGASRKVG
jgi:hypothetical protein